MTSAPRGVADDQGQHPLLKMLLHLLAFSSAATGHLQASVLTQCLKVLVKLAENTSSDFLPRFQCVFQVLPKCLSPETPLPGVVLAVELLSLLADHDQLAPQLCSHSGKAGWGGRLDCSCRSREVLGWGQGQGPRRASAACSPGSS